MKLTDINKNKKSQFKGEARSVKELLASIKNGRFTLDGQKLTVRGNLSLEDLGLTSLLGCPKYVSGKFNCSGNQLKTLEGAPQEVGSFYCDHSGLVSLEGGPKKVNENFDCSHNRLKTLIGAPEFVGYSFICNNNELKTLEGAPKRVGDYFDCSHNYLETLKGAPQEVGDSFLCDFNELQTLEGGPTKVKYTYSCTNNKLTSLKGSPPVIGDDFRCSWNELTSLEDCPHTIRGSLLCEENKLLTSLKGAPRFVGGNVSFSGCTNLISLQNIHLHFKKINGMFYFREVNDRTSILGLLLIQLLKGVVFDNETITVILNKYIEKRNRNLLACALELVEAGYDEQAKL
jgi:hypothetical protein